MVWDWNYAWYIGIGLAIILFSWFMLKKKKMICDHNFIPNGYLNVQDRVRMIMVCKKCGQAIHSAVPSKKQLKQKEEVLYARYLKN